MYGSENGKGSGDGKGCGSDYVAFSLTMKLEAMEGKFDILKKGQSKDNGFGQKLYQYTYIHTYVQTYR